MSTSRYTTSECWPSVLHPDDPQGRGDWLVTDEKTGQIVAYCPTAQTAWLACAALNIFAADVAATYKPATRQANG